MKKFSNNPIITLLVVSFALALLGLGGPTVALAATAPDLGAAATFSVLGAAAMSSANPTTISGDLGLSPGLEVSKTGTWTHTGGSEYFGVGGLSASAQTAALSAFNNLAGQTTSGTWGISPWSPAPGVWTDTSSPVFTGTITLNGDYDDVWVFQISTDFTFTGSVVLSGNAQACNVFWQVARDATIGSDSNFVGTLIASGNITSASGSTINGRLISLNGTFLAMNGTASTISGPTCVAAPVVPIQGGRRIVDGTINIVKKVINDNGGTKTISDFPLFINGAPVVSGETYSFASGAYAVTETADSNYTTTFSLDCATTGQLNIASNDIKYCLVTNDDIGKPVVVPPVPPLIDVVKVPDPLALPAGPGAVRYTYTLKNIGTVPVTDITMVGDSCSPIALASGDSNGDAKLQVNETWVYHCSTTLAATHTNTVVATGWANGISAVDIASATVVVGVPIVPPLIHVVKKPSVFTLPAAGGAVTYTYTVTNPGTAPLSNVSIIDDRCTGLPGRVLGHPGDLNKNNLLESNEAWSFTCKTNLTKTTTNTGTAEGEANGLSAKDFAIATVVVANAVPKLPNTGLFPLEKSILINIVIPAGVAIVLAFLYFIRRKQIA